MKRRTVLALSGALSVAALAGCSGDSTDTEPAVSSPESESGTNGTAGNETTGETDDEGEPSEEQSSERDEEQSLDVDDETLEQLAADTATFALTLHEEIAADHGNLCISPYSLSAAMAMTYAGARGETRDQIERTVELSLQSAVHPAFGELSNRLEGRDATELHVANALWGAQSVPFEQSFLDTVDENYGAGIRQAAFSATPGRERDRINDWVADQTDGNLAELLPADAITTRTVAVLTNAVYFAAGWMDTFDPDETGPGTFTNLDGSETTVQYMENETEVGYAEGEQARAVELPYVGEDVSMVFLLPDERTGIEAFESELTQQQLFERFEQMDEQRIPRRLRLPKFEFESSVALKETFEQIGMPRPFQRLKADFSGMVRTEGTEQNVFIDQVYHDAFVSVDEEGTEASGASAVVGERTLRAPQIEFDRPFLFCLRDRPTNAVLFLGRVVNAERIESPG